jgi:hypothetical protein
VGDIISILKERRRKGEKAELGTEKPQEQVLSGRTL